MNLFLFIMIFLLFLFSVIVVINVIIICLFKDDLSKNIMPILEYNMYTTAGEIYNSLCFVEELNKTISPKSTTKREYRRTYYVKYFFKEKKLPCDFQKEHNILVKKLSVSIKGYRYKYHNEYILIDMPEIVKCENESLHELECLDCLVQNTNPIKLGEIKDIRSLDVPYSVCYAPDKNNLKLVRVDYKKNGKLASLLMYYNENYEESALEVFADKKRKIIKSFK